jgi:beta-glucosidase
MSGAVLQFPDGFLWGAATSAHQVEGNNVHSDWWVWEQMGRVKDRSGLACDHYRRFAQDFDLAASLGHNAHRFSVEWARIEPAEGQWDDEALAHYVAVVRALRARRLEPIVTLHHFTNPEWFLAKGGWIRPGSVDLFARYVRRVAAALGDAVRYWVTINEPMVYVRLHYLLGLGPPGERDLRQAMRVVEHMVRGHAAAYRILHGERRTGWPVPLVSIAHHAAVFWPCKRWSPLDRWITRKSDQVFNAVLEAMTEGRWVVPGVADWRFPEARNTLDYFGINYYGRQFIRWAPAAGPWPGATCDLGHHPREVPERTGMGWDIHPDSLFELLRRLGRLGQPILVTENGTSMADDERRWSFLQRHIAAVGRAVQAGANVLGYCCWSLLDNFEWADGYGPRFGIVEVNYQTQERILRGSARKYAEVCRSNRVPVSDTDGI